MGFGVSLCINALICIYANCTCVQRLEQGNNDFYSASDSTAVQGAVTLVVERLKGLSCARSITDRDHRPIMHDDSHSPDCSCCLDHDSAHQGVLDALELMAGHPEASEDEIVQLLLERGYSPIAAQKLTVFVPSAFSWIVLKRLG